MNLLISYYLTRKSRWRRQAKEKCALSFCPRLFPIGKGPPEALTVWRSPCQDLVVQPAGVRLVQREPEKFSFFHILGARSSAGALLLRRSG